MRSRFFVYVLIILPLFQLAGCQSGGTSVDLGKDSTATGNLTGIQKLSAGMEYSLLLKDNGTVWGWGSGSSGQLGHGTANNAALPVQVSGLTSAIDIKAGGIRSLALLSDGTVWMWGGNYSGYLGTADSDNCILQGSSFPCAKEPVQVTALSGIVAIAEGSSYTAALMRDGTVWGWGSLYDGMIGNGVSASVSAPAQVAGLSGITAISAGSNHMLALKSDGTVWAWGYNAYGQLGTQINGSPLPLAIVGLDNVGAISAGGYQSLALKKDGTVWAWGSNGVLDASATPEKLALDSIKAISAGSKHALALKSDGSVWAWGNNEYGQLGIGGTSVSTAPMVISGVSNVIDISAGYTHSLGLRKDGSVWVWGQVNEQSVTTIDKCTFTYTDTHGTNPSGKTTTYDAPCAKQPVQVITLGAVHN